MSDPFAGEDFWRGDPFGPFREDNAPPPSLRALLTDPRKRPEDEHEYDASIPPFLWAPPPVLATMDPNTAQEGSTVAVTVTGSGFILSSVVHAGTTALPTVYVSDTELTATYTPSAPGVVDVTVRNGTRVSNSLPFTVSAIPPPAVTTLAPDSSNLSTTTTVVVTGTNYTSASVVHADGVALPTTYTSATSLSAQYTSPATVGPVAFTVHDGPRVSNAVTFTVEDVFTPDRLPGLYGWFDAADPTTFVYSSGEEISEWVNKGSGVSFAQPVIGQQPYRNTVDTQGGNARISFDASVGDCLENSLFFNGPNPGNPSARPYTEYLVLHPYGTSYGVVHTSPYTDRTYLAPDTATWRYMTGGGSVSWPVGVPPVDHQPQIFTFTVSANGPLKAYRDGVQVAAGTNSGWSIDNGLRIGGRMDGQEIWRSFFYAYFELLVFEGEHDDATRRQVEEYLQDKWATPALPQDLDPTTIAGLDTWLDAADADSFAYSSGAEISQWSDRSGNEHHATQPTVANQPTLQGAVYFGPAPDTLGCSTDWDGTTVRDVFYLAMAGDPNTQYCYVQGGWAGTICLKGFQPVYSFVTSTSWYTDGTGPVTDYNVWHQDDVRIFPDGGLHLNRDGALRATGVLSPWTPTPAPSGVSFGGGGWWQVFEFLVYTTVSGLSDEERTKIRNYLRAKWGV